ncbi:flagellar biosynthetic protein FliO, partial [Aeromonas caviae]|uniref:flagellar biosynthetic protein FliO n=1 Tax=Aeromonas caviae TaxID=648 RepID=UPI001FC88D17
LMGGAYLRSRIKQAGKWDQETIVSFFLCQYCSGEYLRQQLLVGVTPQQVNFLYRLEEPLDESQPQAFSEQLGKLMGKHEKR